MGGGSKQLFVRSNLLLLQNHIPDCHHIKVHMKPKHNQDYFWCTGRVTESKFFPGGIWYGRGRDRRGNRDAPGTVALYPGCPTGASERDTPVCPFIKTIVTAVLLPAAGKVQMLLRCSHRGHFRPLQSELKKILFKDRGDR